MSRSVCRLILISFTALMLAGFVFLDAMAPAGRRAAKVGGLDPVNYFGIAHSLLFDHDFNLNNEFTRIKPDGDLWSKRQAATGLPGSPWGIGYSVVAIPFLALGAAVDAAAGNPPDGFSHFAIYFYCLTNVVMVGLGLLALFSFLRRVGLEWGMPEPRANTSALLLSFAIFFGTNTGYYAFSQLSHAAAFLFVGLFLGLWWRIRDLDSTTSWLRLGLIGGFLSIIRWQDLVFLVGPVLYDLLERAPFRRGKTWLRSRALFAAGVLVCWIPQIFEWKIIYGKYLTVPQGPGFLSFPPAYMAEVLFSSRNGFFLWTPLAFIGLAGLIYAAIKRGNVVLPWLLVVALELAAAGSMKTWHGFDSFSSRYMHSTCPLVALGLLALAASPGVILRRAMAGAAVACCVFSTLFGLEFGLHLVPLNDRLTLRELVLDRFEMPRVRRQKKDAAAARDLLAAGNAPAAVELLQHAESEGESREILTALDKASRLAGNTAVAEDTERKWRVFLDSRLW